MKEVSCRNFEILFTALSEKGIDHEKLTERMPQSLEFLKKGYNRIDWEDMVKYLVRLRILIGENEELVNIGQYSFKSKWLRPYSQFLGLATNPYNVYWIIDKVFGNTNFSNIVSSLNKMDDGRLNFTLEIPEPYSESAEFFWISKGHFIVTPKIIGQPEAKVEAQITPRRGVFIITLPKSKTLLSRFKQLFKLIFLRNTTIDELRFQQQQLKNSYDELEQASEKLAESEDRLRCLFETAFSGMLIHENGIILDANAPAAEIFGYSCKDLIGKSALEFIAGESQEQVKDRFSSNKEEAYEIIFKKNDGSPVYIEILSKPYNFKGKTARIVALRDITKRKKLEEEILKAKKLESVGVLAGGIAHDFNNLLLVNLINLNMARDCTGINSDAEERIDKATQSVIMAKNLSEKLLTFSLGGTPVKSTVNLEKLIKEVSKLTLADSSIKCGYLFDKNIYSAEADESQISQVISNLIINAKEALGGKGIIRISAENVDIKNKENVIARSGSDEAISISNEWDCFTPNDTYGVRNDGQVPIPDGKYIKITITNNGQGIAKESLSKIFEPFFTTKDQGTGLGLTTASSIIEKHDGYICVESRPEEETSFYFYLPASEKQTKNVIASEPFDLAQDMQSKRGNLSNNDANTCHKGKILVVDDLEDILEALQFGLSKLGFNVEIAKNGNNAIEIFRSAHQSCESFDAIVMDLTIPGGMGGKEAVKRLIDIDPNVKVIASSGYSNNEVASNYSHHGFCNFIAKPYEIKDLARILVEATS